ncbi:neuronal acetylcholine receptor subunit alpha-2-like [Strongylocentrotus purpuratus]|uniref:Neurotransmitter-gated ion-channel ligand-binding domain-containing protein n=1 Tax=Strongylocentrotus purpuratus TaxID=7668 RepID=A0A7M7NW94_STRPU|nr:neuronal acetylcholine receptor subunit alpha-2-like [Strongylocentrotus purpuratus]
MKFFYGYLILLGVASLTCTTAQDNSEWYDHALLRANLLSTYAGKETLPYYDQANRVNLGMSLTKLRGLDLFKGTIQMNVWMNLAWSDPRLAWDPTTCGNITKLHLLPSEIWVPDITLFNSNSPSESLRSGVSAIVYADGSVFYDPPMHLEATCTVDLTDYPYDQHNCSLKWGSWAYGASVITIDSISDSIDLSETVDHPIWDIINQKATKHTDFYYSCCPGETFEDVTFSLVVRRRETHGRIASSVVTAWLILIVFLISPSSAGVRIVFAGSVLIALVVLSAALSAEVPAYSTTRLGRFLIVGMLILAFVSVVNGLIYRFYPKEKPGQLNEGDGSSPPRVLLIIDIGAFVSTVIILGISTGALFV